MAINAETPRWLEALAANPPNYSGLGQLAGRYAGSLVNSFTGSGDEQIESKPFYQRFRTNLANTYKQDQDPNWRLREFLAQNQYQQGLLQAKSLMLQNNIRMQQLKQQTDAEGDVAAWSQEVQQAGGGPEAILNTPFFKANPHAVNTVNSIKLNASRALVEQRLNSDRIEANKLADSLSPEDRAIFYTKPRNPNGTPSAEGWQFLREAAARATERQKKLDEFKMEDKPTSQMKNIEAIFQFENKAKALDEAGDVESANQFREQATMLRDQLKGQDMEITTDDQGRMMFRMGKGLKPTVATQTQAQQKLIKYENAMELINYLQQNMKAGHLGVSGLLGETIGDKLLPQFGIDTSNQKRVDVRTSLVALREGLLREMSDDTRFSNADREEIKKALPSSGALESLPDALQRLDTVRRVLTNRGQVYSGAIGKMQPLWSMSPDEIVQAVASGQLTKEAATDALRRFHNYQ